MGCIEKDRMKSFQKQKGNVISMPLYDLYFLSCATKDSNERKAKHPLVIFQQHYRLRKDRSWRLPSSPQQSLAEELCCPLQPRSAAAVLQQIWMCPGTPSVLAPAFHFLPILLSNFGNQEADWRSGSLRQLCSIFMLSVGSGGLNTNAMEVSVERFRRRLQRVRDTDKSCDSPAVSAACINQRWDAERRGGALPSPGSPLLLRSVLGQAEPRASTQQHTWLESFPQHLTTDFFWPLLVRDPWTGPPDG